MQKIVLLVLTAIVGVAACSHTPQIITPDAPQENAARGRALVQGVAACGFCHGERADPLARLTGGRPSYDRYGEVVAPNLTRAQGALGDWEAADVTRAFRASVGKDGRELSSEVHRGYEWMADQDAFAIVAYLRTVSAVSTEVPRRNVSWLQRNTTGLFESRPSDVGFVPRVNEKFPAQYGYYLVHHVARCVNCHNGPVGFWGGEELLAGGRTIHTDAGERVAPPLRASKEGLVDWTEEQVLTFLKTGLTPRGTRVDSKFCPTLFFSQGSADEQSAIVKYLKSLPPVSE